MLVREIKELLEATIYACEEKENMTISTACGSDLMSDVLAFVKEQAMLLTGVCNLQALRTAELMDIKVLCMVRSKVPTDEMIDYARNCGIVLMSTTYPMFVACGRLYNAGIVGGGKLNGIT